MTSDLKTRFAAADEIGAPDLWGEARRRAATPVTPPRAAEWPPGRARRVAVAALAFALFAVAIAFAWDLVDTDRRPAPRPPAAVDLAAELPTGWSELPPPPEDRSDAATAWTGSQLLVWGGYEFVGSGDEDPDRDGFVFDAATRKWTPMPESPLEGRSGAASAWTGRELLVWGGWDGGWREVPYFSNGAAYDPAARIWRTLPPAPISERRPFSVWTGTELIVWGSAERFPRLRDGAAYDPSTDTWRRIAEAPTDITDGSAVWTGEEMIVFGAALDGNNHADTPTAIGIAYDPAADTWRELPPSELSPQAMTASWLDGAMIAWDYDQSSAAYDPATNVWRDLERVPLAFSECYPMSVATSAVVFGEFCGKTVVFSPSERAWHREPMPALQQPDDGCCWVHEPVAAGHVVLVPSHLYTRLGLVERRMLVYNPPDLVRTDPTGQVVDPEPFLPATTRDGEHLRMPIVFPDGTEATLVSPISLGLETMGLQPDLSYAIGGRFQGHLVFIHDPEASLDRFVADRRGAILVNSSVGGLELWPAREGAFVNPYDTPPDRRFVIRFALPSWTVLIPLDVPTGTGLADRAQLAALVASSLGIRETSNGFPVVESVGEEAPPTRDAYATESPFLTFGDSLPEPDAIALDDMTVSLRTVRDCDLEPEVADGFGSVCLSESIQANIGGDREFVQAVVDGLRVGDPPRA